MSDTAVNIVATMADPWLAVAKTLEGDDLEQTFVATLQSSYGTGRSMKIHGSNLQANSQGKPTGGSVDHYELYDGNTLAITVSGFGPVDFVEFYENISNNPTATYLYLISLLDSDSIATGSKFADDIEVGAGNDTVTAGDGDDSIFKWNVGNLTADGGDGTDTLEFSANAGSPYPTPFVQQLVVNLGTGAGKNPYGGTLSVKNIENVIGTYGADIITGSTAANFIGDPFDTGADIIRAGSGNDIIQLGWGVDGGAKVDGGPDTDELRFQVTDQDFESSTIVLDIENPSLNTFVFKGGTYTNLEVFRAGSSGLPSDTDIFRFGGSDAAETVIGTSVQTFVGPTFRPFVGRDELYGRGGNDVLRGLAGNDRLDGGTGVDRLEGFQDDDTYIVDNPLDVIVEVAGDGTADKVLARASYTLDTGVDVELVATVSSTATTAIDLTGNALKQEITGNYGANVLRDGPSGGAADVLKGLNGNDTYRIYNSGTTIVESTSAAGGTADRVAAGVDYALASGVGVELMQTNGETGTSAIDLTGNALKQMITGNAGVNILHDGGTGAADTMAGLGGSDTYRVFNSGDIIVEASGSAAGTADKVIAAADYTLAAGVFVEIMQTNGSTGTSAINLTGNEIAQTLIGNAGSNILDGKGGSDTLQGGSGKDFFVFSTALGASNIDTIADFSAAADTIRLENAVFTKLTSTGTLSSSFFRANTTGTAQDANDYVVYETDTGKLFYDSNGNAAGGSVHFATLVGKPSLTAADFVVI